MTAGGHRRLRPAQPGDASDLARIDVQVNMSPWSVEEFRRVCAASDDVRERIVVAEQGGVPVGFAVYAWVLDEGTIHNIAVQASCRRQGLGAALLERALKELGNQGNTRCLLELRVSNVAAHALYERFGFEVDGVRKGYYPTVDSREDAVLMSKML